MLKEETLMNLQAAVIKEQGVTFAVVVVKKHIVDNKFQGEQAIQSFSSYFPGMPIVLMAQDTRGVAHYLGRKDLVNFLSRLHISQIPWRNYSVNAA